MTRNNSRRVLRTAFSFALARNYCVDNPAAKTAKAKEIEGTVGILTVAETARLLEAADAELVPFIAIGAFAGLRRAELERLDWSELDFESGLITVQAVKAKSARRRFVKIRPNLASWLTTYAAHRGAVTPCNCRKMLEATRNRRRIEAVAQQRAATFVCIVSSGTLQRRCRAGAGTRTHGRRACVSTLPADRETEGRRKILESNAYRRRFFKGCFDFGLKLSRIICRVLRSLSCSCFGLGTIFGSR